MIRNLLETRIIPISVIRLGLNAMEKLATFEESNIERNLMWFQLLLLAGRNSEMFSYLRNMELCPDAIGYDKSSEVIKQIIGDRHHSC